MPSDQTEALAKTVLAGAPPGTLIVETSIAPDGRRAAALMFLPSANYLMDDLLEWIDGTWRSQEGGSGGPGMNWSGGDIGVLRFSGEAPGGAQTAVIRFDGSEHRVPIKHGHFLFVAWDTPFSHDPEVIRFD
jgi:hypothetical protein